MVTENGSPRYAPPSAESDLRGRRKIPHPPRLDPLKIDPRAPRTKQSTPRSSPRSPRSPHLPRSHSPLPPAPQTATDDRPWLPESLRAGSPQGRDEWRTKQSSTHTPLFTPPPDRTPPMWYTHDNDFDRQNHRKGPPARGGLRISMSTSRLPNRRPRPQVSPDRSQDSVGHGLPLPRFPSKGPADDKTLRTSFNSAMTSRSSIEQHSGTERSSVLTKSSSITDLSPDTPDGPYGMDDGMSVEDAISMYLDGFSDVAEEPSSPTSRAESKAPSITPPPSRDAYLEGAVMFPPRTTSLESVPPIRPPSQSDLPETAYFEPELSQLPIPEPIMEIASPPQTPPPPPPPVITSEPAPQEPNLPEKASPKSPSSHQRQPSKIIIPGPYEAWKGSYSGYAAHRRSKWQELLKEHGLQTADPTVFPAQSNKVKRFVRKGIPSEFRGAAWFWYAGGYELLNRNPGHYDRLVEKVMASPSNDDKEHIERDLHRTFPDNLHFKPESVDGGPQNSNITTETQMIQSLRQVLYAFALHNPKVGYTQSLNFITGMLLLFLPEEKAFWMLHIITSVYLPGTHEVSLEGANIDLWILMVLLRDSMPSIYSKIASMDGSSIRGKPPALTVNSRLPDITLGLTNWLMSIFIGTLPLETTLRVWDIFFYEGSKTFFRVSLAIFKACERDILAVSDPMEVFQVVQTVPKRLLDVNTLLEDCFVRRHRVGQGRIEELRAARRVAVRQEKLRRSVAFSKGQIQSATDNFPGSRNGGADIEQRVVNSWRNLKQHAFHREPGR
ncbi:GTPase-activating protein gyp3 [Penicillium subrubescens]|uniref:GTPase-activating protein gyp3 n=1 Tax=Penicillium subrubescens TaxID=1316194 RepID=UPI0025450F4D|nr:GTPase-activating protein gyp3 [Penicillium subrubescens]KAJ5891003.1 GTPase-activating protein gyp3 [Penicillium subrubescens]